MIAAALVAAQYLGTFDFSDRTDVRYRVTEQSSPVAPTTLLSGVDLATMITARARIVDRRWEFTLAYIPDPDRSRRDPVHSRGPGHHSAATHSVRSFLHSLALSPATTDVDGRRHLWAVQLCVLVPAARGRRTARRDAGRSAVRKYIVSFVVHRCECCAEDRPPLQLCSQRGISGKRSARRANAAPRHSDASTGRTRPASFDFMLDRADHLVTSATPLSTTFSSAPCAPVAGMTAPPLGITCAPESEVAWVQEEVRHQVSPSRPAWWLGSGSESRRCATCRRARPPILKGSRSPAHPFPTHSGPTGQDVLLASASAIAGHRRPDGRRERSPARHSFAHREALSRCHAPHSRRRRAVDSPGRLSLPGHAWHRRGSGHVQAESMGRRRGGRPSPLGKREESRVRCVHPLLRRYDRASRNVTLLIFRQSPETIPTHGHPAPRL
jgi:hypothetical protein